MRNRVGQQHFGRHTVGVHIGDPQVAVPVPLSCRDDQIIERADVGLRPRVELVVQRRGQIRLVVPDIGPGVGVG